MTNQDATQMRLERLKAKHTLLDSDAIILDCLNELVKAYNYFITEVLNIDKNPNESEYKSNMKIQDFFSEVEKLTTLLTNVSTSLRNSHPQVSQVFAPKIDAFQKDIQTLNTVGKKETVLKLGINIRNFKLELGDLIKSGKPEKMLDTYMIISEERTQRIWTAGQKKLAKFDDATILLQWLVEYGRGVPMTIIEISLKMTKSESWVEKHMREIRENAPELLKLGQGIHDKTTYYVPKDFHAYSIGGD